MKLKQSIILRHSIFIARKYTEVKDVLNGFLEGIGAGQCRSHGSEATPLTLSYNLYSIAYQFYRKKFGLDRHVHKDIKKRALWFRPMTDLHWRQPSDL